MYDLGLIFLLQLAEEVEKISSKEQALQLKILDLENELRQKKQEHKQLARKLNDVSRYLGRRVLLCDYRSSSHWTFDL